MSFVLALKTVLYRVLIGANHPELGYHKNKLKINDNKPVND